MSKVGSSAQIWCQSAVYADSLQIFSLLRTTPRKVLLHLGEEFFWTDYSHLNLSMFVFLVMKSVSFCIMIHSFLTALSPFDRQKLYCANIYLQYISWFSTFSAFTSIVSVERETVAVLNYTEGLLCFSFFNGLQWPRPWEWQLVPSQILVSEK